MNKILASAFLIAAAIPAHADTVTIIGNNIFTTPDTVTVGGAGVQTFGKRYTIIDMSRPTPIPQPIYVQPTPVFVAPAGSASMVPPRGASAVELFDWVNGN